MRTKKLEVNLFVFEDDNKELYCSKFNNQEIIEKLMNIINEYHAKEMYEYIFED